MSPLRPARVTLQALGTALGFNVAITVAFLLLISFLRWRIPQVFLPREIWKREAIAKRDKAAAGGGGSCSGASTAGAARDGDLLGDEHLYFAGWAASLWHDLPECQRAACTYAPELAGQPEYFAAATEAFLRRPSSLRAAAPSVSAALAHFYLYDPSRWNRGVRAPAA